MVIIGLKQEKTNINEPVITFMRESWIGLFSSYFSLIANMVMLIYKMGVFVVASLVSRV